MDRRHFVRTASMAAAAAGISRITGGGLSVHAAAVAHRGAQTAGASAAERDPRGIIESALVVDGLDPSSLKESYLDMLETAGVTCWHKSMGGIDSFSSALKFADAHSDRIVIASTVRDIRDAQRQGKIALMFGWQSVESVLAAPFNPVGGPYEIPLRAYRQLGLRVVGIAYNIANAFGGGNLDDPAVGLTSAGRRLVEEIHEQRLVLDIGGHTGEKTSFDAIAMSPGVPVICSHTNIRALNENPRCISDRLIEAIAETGGVVGITAMNDFHARNPSNANEDTTPQVGLDRHLNQYDHIRKLVGADHVALGPDFVEGSTVPTDEQSNTVIWPWYWNSKKWIYIKGFENITELPNVVSGLLDRGWSAAEIRKVLGENWLRVYERVWGA